jgi:hypothetical protein
MIPALALCAAVTLGPPLNLRTVPNGPVIVSMVAGETVSVDSNAGNWMHVVSRFGPGWAYGPYMIPVPCAPPPAVIVPPVIGNWSAVLLCNFWGCRSSPYVPPPIVVTAPPVVQIGPGPQSRPPDSPPREALPQPPLTQDQQREDIIRQGEEFCQRYQHDPICHRPKDQPK